MNRYTRKIQSDVTRRLQNNPVVALLGPRQCGKTTLAKLVADQFVASIYLDLENRRHVELLTEPEILFEQNIEKLIVIDEIQLRPQLFGILRAHIDCVDRKCRFLILGSASRDLIKQGAESLAGRVSFLNLTPFLLEEVPDIHFMKHWARGSFPLSLLAPDDLESIEWREDYLQSLISRDLPALGLPAAPHDLRRLLMMLGHVHGELVNYSKLGESLGLTYKTIQSYVGFLEGAFFLRILPAFSSNAGKRLVKTPKLYYRDVGVLAAILGAETFNGLMAHPQYGNSWEGFAIEQILNSIGDRWLASFYRTQSGAEIDLVLEKGEIRIAVEFKASTSPSVSKGFWIALDDLGILPENAWVVSPVEGLFPYKKGVRIGGIKEFVESILNR